MTDLFVSYASVDRERVKPIIDALRRKGWSVWWDRTIRPGETWDQTVEKAVSEARCIVVIWSTSSIKSKWVRTEAHEGMRREILVPARIDDVSIPMPFGIIQTANLIYWTDKSPNAEFDQLTEGISAVLFESHLHVSGTRQEVADRLPKFRAPELAERQQVFESPAIVGTEEESGPETKTDLHKTGPSAIPEPIVSATGPANPSENEARESASGFSHKGGAHSGKHVRGNSLGTGTKKKIPALVGLAILLAAGFAFWRTRWTDPLEPLRKIDWNTAPRNEPHLADCRGYKPCEDRRTFFAQLNSPQSKTKGIRYFGGIEIGSRGVSAGLFSLTQTPDGAEIDLIFGHTIDTRLLISMQGDQFTASGIKDASAAAKTLIGEMENEARTKNCGPVEYFVVGSSAITEAKNNDALASAISSVSGVETEFIDAKHEGYFNLTSTVPTGRISAALHVDIGARNTILGCMVGGADISAFRSVEIPFGSVTLLRRAAQENTGDLVAGIQKVGFDKVRSAYEQLSIETPCLRNRQRIYWTDGTAWAVAALTHPERSLMPRLYITTHDLEMLSSKLTDGSWNQEGLKYSFPSETSADLQVKIRKRAERDRNDVLNTFAREDLLSGVTIMRNILASGNPSAVLVFSRESGFMYGYALEQLDKDVGSTEHHN